MNGQELQPVALTIAGSDSGGGAGIQADLRAFRDFGVHGCCAITALTAQNPMGVRAVQGADPGVLRAQLEAVAEAFTVGAVKTGMLLNEALIRTVAAALPLFRDAQGKRAAWVVDPVMIATSGTPLLEAKAVGALREVLLPEATVVTPNLPEALALLGKEAGQPVRTVAAVADLAEALREQLGTAVLVKGGHLEAAPSVDVLAEAGGETVIFEAPCIQAPLTTHGTGCTLSSAIAANIALGRSLREAVLEAKAYLLALLSATQWAGKAAVYGRPTVKFSAADIQVSVRM